MLAMAKEAGLSYASVEEMLEEAKGDDYEGRDWFDFLDHTVEIKDDEIVLSDGTLYEIVHAPNFDERLLKREELYVY